LKINKHRCAKVLDIMKRGLIIITTENLIFYLIL
jgi:hypothetical protein